MSQENLDDLDIYESSLTKKMEQELNKYKKNLILKIRKKTKKKRIKI